MSTSVNAVVDIAVVGAGGWGKNHVRTWGMLPGIKGSDGGTITARLHMVCDKDEKTLAQVKQQFPDVTCTASLDEVLKRPNIKGVVLATDAPTHASLAKQILDAGKDAFVEKPLTLSPKESSALCELAEQKNAVLMVGHLLLYHTAVRRLKQLIDAGELGEVLYLTSERTNLGVVRRDENAWWSLAPHDVAVCNYLLSSSPSAVTSTGGVFLQKDRSIEDVVFSHLEYPGGKMAHIHVSWLDPHKTRRLTVVGSKKMAVFDDGSPDQKLVLFDKGVEPPKALSYAEGVRVRTGDIVIPALRMTEPLVLECQAFLEAIATRQAPLAHGRSGHDVVSVLEAGTRSLATGARVKI